MDHQDKRSDDITSRRTNISGRTLITAGGAATFSSFYNWKLVSVWGLSDSAGILQNQLNWVGIIVLIFLTYTHIVNWYPDFLASSTYRYELGATLDTTQKNIKKLTQRLAGEKSIKREETGIEIDVNLSNLEVKLHETKVYAKELNAHMTSHRLQIFYLHLVPPLIVGVFGTAGLVFRLISP